MADLNGTWTGRLIDIRGFEGEIVLRLESEEGEVRGRADVRILTQHEVESYRLPIVGETGKRGRILLKGSAGEDAGVEFGIEGVVFELPADGLGLRGTYEVVARQFTALSGGVIVCSKGGRLPTVEVRPERTIRRREFATPQEVET